jgi:hypothetical protein
MNTSRFGNVSNSSAGWPKTCRRDQKLPALRIGHDDHLYDGNPG